MEWRMTAQYGGKPAQRSSAGPVSVVIDVMLWVARFGGEDAVWVSAVGRASPPPGPGTL